MFGDQGNDIICGCVGDDTIYGDSEKPLPVATLGTQGHKDKLFGGTGNDLMFGNQDQDTLYAEEGDDTLLGGKDNDVLCGDQGNDSLLGEAGDDLLYGGEGDDTFSGGIGSDTFLVNFDQGIDVITDFNVTEDFLVLGNGLTTNEQSFTLNTVDGNTSVFWNDIFVVTLENLSATSEQIETRFTNINNSLII